MIKRKIKPFMPSLKEKKRYLAFAVISDGCRFDAREVSQVVGDAVADYLGSLGKGHAGTWMIADSWDSERQMGLLRVNNRYVNEVKAALTLVESVNGREAIFRSVGLSGVLRKAKMYIQ